jgi:hypothetical protein
MIERARRREPICPPRRECESFIEVPTGTGVAGSVLMRASAEYSSFSRDRRPLSTLRRHGHCGEPAPSNSALAEWRGQLRVFWERAPWAGSAPEN